METGWTRIERLTPADRETVALALFRAGYEVRQKKEKQGKTTVIHLEYRR